MAKTSVAIKQKLSEQAPVQAPASVTDEIPTKRRGRPPKSTVVANPPQTQSDSKPVTTTKVYSLVNHASTTGNENVFLMPLHSTIVQLRITKEDIDNYETHGDPKDMTILSAFSSTSNSVPIAYNEYTGTSMSMPPQLQPATQATNKTPSVFNLLVKPKPPKSVPIATPTPTPTPIPASGDRRNLIINSGVERKVSKLLAGFASIEWPNYSQYNCWYDCHQFSSAPVGIPEKLVPEISEAGSPVVWKFYLYGNFCSYNCAARYLNPHDDNIDDRAVIDSNFDLVRGDQKSEQMQLLELLAHMETGHKLTEKIKLAPPRLSLKSFGGKLSLEEFRQNFLQHREYHVFKAPLVPITYELEEISGVGVNSKSDKTNIPIDYSRFEKAYLELSQQREQLRSKSVIGKMLTKGQSQLTTTTDDECGEI